MPRKFELDGGDDLNKIAEQLERMTGTDGDELEVRSESERIADDIAGVAPEDARPPRQAVSSTARWVNVLLGVAILAVLASGTFVAIKFAGRKAPVTQVSVPDVAGLTPAEADTQLRDLGLSASVKYDTASDKPDGTIVGTTPPAGAEVEKGAVVTLTVAKKSAAPSGTTPGDGQTPNPVPTPAPTKVSVPDVETMARVRAVTLITDAGLRPKVDFRRSDATLPRDTVIMTDPPKGTQLERGSVVTLFVNGKTEDGGTPTPVIPLPEVITLKDYTGLPASVVEQELRDLGLSPRLEYQVTRVQRPQHVISTNPAAGTAVSSKAVIRVLVARQ